MEELDELCNIIPIEEMQRVLRQDMCEIDGTFLGFTKVYKNLAEIIPKHFTVIDFGCAYNPQCYYFSEHKQIISIDVGNEIQTFNTPNNTYYGNGIQAFLEDTLPTLNLNLDETFAICSYVPPWYGFNNKMIRDIFSNLFIYYPSGTSKNIDVPNRQKDGK